MATRKLPPPTSLWTDPTTPAKLEGEFHVFDPGLTPTQFVVSRSMFDTGKFTVRLTCPSRGAPRVVALIPVDANSISSQDELNALGENMLLLYRLTHCKSD